MAGLSKAVPLTHCEEKGVSFESGSSICLLSRLYLSQRDYWLYHHSEESRCNYDCGIVIVIARSSLVFFSPFVLSLNSRCKEERKCDTRHTKAGKTGNLLLNPRDEDKTNQRWTEGQTEKDRDGPTQTRQGKDTKRQAKTSQAKVRQDKTRNGQTTPAKSIWQHFSLVLW